MRRHYTHLNVTYLGFIGPRVKNFLSSSNKTDEEFHKLDSSIGRVQGIAGRMYEMLKDNKTEDIAVLNKMTEGIVRFISELHAYQFQLGKAREVTT